MPAYIFQSPLRILAVPVAIVTLAFTSACERASMTAPGSVERLSISGGANLAPTSTPAGVNAQLAELRRLTAHYRDLDDAMAAGYTIQVTPCLELPNVGGMGFHYGNPAYINNAVVSLLQPELLLYEPQKNGNLRFVGVEYIIPFNQLPPTSTPPTLLGRSMHQNTAAGIWALHVWVGKHNPAGMFEDWNPTVSCEFAP